MYGDEFDGYDDEDGGAVGYVGVGEVVDQDDDEIIESETWIDVEETVTEEVTVVTEWDDEDEGDYGAY